VVNLACKAVLASITNMKFVQPHEADYVPQALTLATSRDARKRDPIAILRSLIKSVCDIN
jgi:hypothetical protein